MPTAYEACKGTPASAGVGSDTIAASWCLSDSQRRPRYSAISVPPFGSAIEMLPDEQEVFIEPAKERRRRKDREAKLAYRRMSAERLSLMSVDSSLSTECSQRNSLTSSIDSAFIRERRSRCISELSQLSSTSSAPWEDLAAVAEYVTSEQDCDGGGASSIAAHASENNATDVGCVPESEEGTEDDDDVSSESSFGSDSSEEATIPRSPTAVLHDGVQRRAAEQTMVLMLKQHAKRQNARYGRRSTVVETAESRVEDRAEVVGVARDCQVRYCATLEVLEKNMTLRAPKRAHTLTEAELSQYIDKE